jgi:hypothetical protein
VTQYIKQQLRRPSYTEANPQEDSTTAAYACNIHYVARAPGIGLGDVTLLYRGDPQKVMSSLQFIEA